MPLTEAPVRAVLLELMAEDTRGELVEVRVGPSCLDALAETSLKFVGERVERRRGRL